jgi:hypothetical protein
MFSKGKQHTDQNMKTIKAHFTIIVKDNDRGHEQGVCVSYFVKCNADADVSKWQMEIRNKDINIWIKKQTPWFLVR